MNRPLDLPIRNHEDPEKSLYIADRENPHIWLALGREYAADGMFDAAIRCFASAIEIDPANGEAYRRMVNCYRAGKDDPISNTLSELLLKDEVTYDDRIGLEFAAGKVADDQRRYRDAFAHYVNGNTLQLARLRESGKAYRDEVYELFVNRSIALYSPNFLKERADWGVQDDAFIFVVGMPRSGTTVIEQILSSTPSAIGAGELTLAAQAVRRLSFGKRHPSATDAANWDRASIGAAAHDYALALRSLMQNKSRIIDKQLDNVLLLGALRLMFPRMKAVICRRDIRDTTLSCYFQRFMEGNEYSYDLDDCIKRHRHIDKLIRHWSSVIPENVLCVQYEDLVTDLPKESKRLFDFVGLQWTADCLQYHTFVRRIETASAWQVRMPLYASSVRRWRNYDFLPDSFLEAINCA
jgi:tetratricopeptide (TPR) repeat protein